MEDKTQIHAQNTPNTAHRVAHRLHCVLVSPQAMGTVGASPTIYTWTRYHGKKTRRAMTSGFELTSMILTSRHTQSVRLQPAPNAALNWEASLSTIILDTCWTVQRGGGGLAQAKHGGVGRQGFRQPIGRTADCGIAPGPSIYNAPDMMDAEGGALPGGTICNAYAGLVCQTLLHLGPYLGPNLGPYLGPYLGPHLGPNLGPYLGPNLGPLVRACALRSKPAPCSV